MSSETGLFDPMALEDAQRLRHVEQEQATLKTEVKGLAATQQTQGAQLDRIEQLILNKPPMWNTGTVLSAVLGVGGIFFGLSQYIAFQVDPIKKELGWALEKLEQHSEVDKQTYYEMGKLHFYMDEDSRDDQHMDERFHWSEDRIRELEAKAAAAGVSREAIGRYMKETRGNLDRHLPNKHKWSAHDD